MIVLHAGFLDERLWLWGEASAGTSLPSKSVRKQKKSPQAVPHPFAADRSALVDSVEEVLPGWSQNVPPAETVTIWLPTVAERPVPSTSLLAEQPVNGEPARLQAWSVTALPMGNVSFLDLLSACIGQSMLKPGVLIGHSLAWWSQVLRFAGALVAREQFLPGLVEKEDSSQARWQPVLNSAESARLTRLAQAMPPACRALCQSAEEPPAVPALTLLNTFLNRLVDVLVRSTVTHPAETPVTRKKPGRAAKSTFDSVHDQWVHALRTPVGLMEGQAAERKKLLEQLEEWRRPITVATVSPFRLCFRLEEPLDDNEEAATKPAHKNPKQWYLRYLLQAVDDPSLLVPVGDAWKKRPGKTSVLNRNGFQPREYLLTTLGQAAAIFPRLEESLKSAAPEGLTLDVAGAFDFLTEKAWLLEQAGLGVLLPAWWSRKGTKQRLSLRAKTNSRKMPAGSGVSLDTLITFDWQVALGEQVLSVEELEALAKLKAPLVRIRGQWVQVSADEIQAALDFWKKKGEGKVPLRELVRMELGAAKAANGLAFSGVQADGWIRDFLNQLQGQAGFSALPPPAEFHGELRPYQERGYSWLAFLRQWGLGACLADDMGLGKTVQALALLERDWENGDRRPTLLICPMSVVGNWQKEAERFTPQLPVLVHHGLKRVKGEAFKKAAEKQALVLSSYSLLHRDIDLLKQVAWRGVILDEAQNVKNPETKQSKAARSLPADFRIALTGTPVENHVGDLWSIMEYLNPGFLGNLSEFRRSFIIPIQSGSDPEASQKLKRLTGPFILRRLKTDKSIIADLPDKLEMKVYCNLTKEQASLYKAVVKEATETLDEMDAGIQRRGTILATLTRLKQACNHPAQLLGDNSAIPGRSGKLARLTEMLEETLSVGDRVLIFTQFTEMGDMIRKHLQETFGKEVLYLHGGVSKKQRDEMVARFQATGGAEGERPQIFLLSLKAGGTGLNLTAANHVFHFDRWWNPAVENQATDRAFRIGQTRNVQVHKFLCIGTLEERIDEMIEHKQDIAGKVVGTGENWLTELSNTQLKELFTLRQEAIGE